ncbi:MAG: DUF4258 domain-containing protein [Spirochaetota bacterium]|nr:DUF4258 domain-containing protein [Spirochaetota bacterium]
MSKFSEIQQRIINQEYYLSNHAETERIEDNVEIEDIENAILKGKLIEKQVDAKSSKYLIQGATLDNRVITVVCTMLNKELRIITVFEE